MVTPGAGAAKDSAGDPAEVGLTENATPVRCPLFVEELCPKRHASSLWLRSVVLQTYLETPQKNRAPDHNYILCVSDTGYFTSLIPWVAP
jgi:hypothetical protein